MNSSADGSVIVQSSCQSAPSTPPWFGEVALVVQYLRQHDILSALSEQVCFARRRFGHYEVIDFLAVLFGYAISGERTLEAFYQRLYPFAAAFMALFGRERLPARSTLSRFLAALPEEPVEVAFPWKAGRFSGHDFAFQPDGTLRCPAGQKLSAHERRREVDGSLRVVYAASIRSCRPCSLREQCQWLGKATTKPRQVSVLLHPLTVGSAPVLWRDWSRRRHRRACIHLLRSQQVAVEMKQGPSACLPSTFLSRAQRAHSRLDRSERFARNARVSTANQVSIKQIARSRKPCALARVNGDLTAS